MDRREFLKASGKAAAGMGLSQLLPVQRLYAENKAASRAGKPNILIIISDQLSFKALAAYGNSFARTPNIDRIVRAGVRFANCYTSCPLCQPARASFWTSRYPHQTGVLSNGRKFPVPPVPKDVPTIGSLFTQAGYEAVHFGKTHDAGALRGFYIEPKKELAVESEKAWPVNYDTKQDRYATTRVVEYLQRKKDKPFIAVADLNNPHNICGWVGENKGPHKDVPIAGELPPLPGNFRDSDFEKRPLAVQYICCSHRRLAQAAQWNKTNYRHYLAAYYHYVSRVDAEIGLILDALKARADAENTLIVFMADHGDGMAAHRMVTKQVSFYDEVARVPFVFAGPGVTGKDVMLAGPLVSLIDLLPTLCDYAGIAIPAGLSGESLLPWLKGEFRGSPHPFVVSEWHTEYGYTIPPGRMLRTVRYKYIRYLESDGEEFYDIVNDPGETRTLVDAPACAEALKEHRALLKKHIEQTADPFFSLSWDVDKRWRSHKPGYENHRGPSAMEVGAK